VCPDADILGDRLRAVVCARSKNRFPTPLDATTKDDVYVGRIRRDISRKDNKGLELFVCGDQIKKGKQGGEAAQHVGAQHSN